MKKITTILLVVFAVTYCIDAYTQTVKFSESFEGVTFPPAGWTTNNVLGTKIWTRDIGTGPLFPPFPNGLACATIDYETSGGEDWLITPQINAIEAEDSLIFYWIKRYSDGPYPPDTCIVRLSNTTNDMASFNTTLLKICVHCTAVGTQIWNKVTIPLAPFAGQNIYIAYQHKDIDGHGMGLDSVQVIGTLYTTIAKNEGTFCKIFPNPATDFVRIQMNGINGKIKLGVFSLEGKQVISEEFENINSQFEKSIDLSNLPKGVYLLNILSNETTLIKKLIIE